MDEIDTRRNIILNILAVLPETYNCSGKYPKQKKFKINEFIRIHY